MGIMPAGMHTVVLRGKGQASLLLYLKPVHIGPDSNQRPFPSDHVPFHWHDELQMSWVFEGELEFCINGDKFLLASDKLLFIKNHQLHSSRTVRRDARTLCINFSPDIFHPIILKNYILPLLENPAFSYALLPLKPYQVTLLEKYRNWKNEPLGYFSVINFLSQIVEEILSEFEVQADQPDYEEMKLFHMALSYVHNHYAEPLTVKQIAEKALVNKSRLTVIFKKYTNMSPIKYLNEYRLYTAKNLIVHTGKTISEISEEVGYRQISHFIQQFRNSYGLPPLKYRNKYGGVHDPARPSECLAAKIAPATD